jgi:2-keto-4-pentenoate hydratase/2-oxohepta-3-ene-1,7-dioic acid hydratase in catechol pathway
MLDLIDDGQATRLEGIEPSIGAEGKQLSEVILCAPIPRPRANVICLGRNYYEHAVESAQARNEAIGKPTFFTKAVTSVIGPYDDIPLHPQLSTELDWEVELAVVIGARARRVSAEHALDHVFGYTVLNDVSARDLQHNFGGQFFYGKSLDGCCPIGPWIVTAEEIPDPQNLTLRLRVNGEIKQESSTRDMIFDVRTVIEILSRAMTLEPGQLIATGTPPGVGFARTPPEFLKSGDVMESEIEGIGLIRNRVRAVS